MLIRKYILLTGVILGCYIDAHSTSNIDSIAYDSIPLSELQEVTVTASRPTTILRADKISYIPSAMVSGGQGNIYETIQTLPGITINSNGEILINGLQSLAVNIDGRKSILSGENLINYLKSVPVTDIERIEVSHFSGAKSEGSDPVATLNIIKRRKKNDSYTSGANIDGQLGKAKQIYLSAYGEFCRKWHSISVNYSHYAAHNPSELLTDRPYLDYEERLTQIYDRKRRDSSHHLSIAYDYRSASGLNIGTSLNYNYSKRIEPAVMTTTVPFVPNPNVTSNNALFVTNNMFGEVYVKRLLSDTKSDWVAACDFFRYNSSESQFMEDNAGMSVDGNMIGNAYGTVGSFDFNKSINKHWHISAGTRISYVDMDNQGCYNTYFYRDSKKIPYEIDNLDSSFSYNENVNALYTEAKGSYGIINAIAGLRAEQSNLNTYFSGNESAEKQDISKSYFHLHPSFSVILSSHKIGSWMLAYVNKVIRPKLSDLDPFIHLFDDITHVGGNINLKEAKRHSLSLTWSDNSHWRIMAVGEYISDDIVKYYRELSDRIVYVTPENFPSHIQILFSIAGGNIGIAPWWNTSLTGNIIYSVYNFSKNTGLTKNALWTPMIDLKNIFQLPWRLTAEFNASYRGSMAFGQAQISPVWNTYIGIKKHFCEGKLSLSLYVKDLFNSNHYKSTILLSGRQAILFEKEFEDMRKIGVSISWKISGGVGISKKEERNVWIDELNRVIL